MYARLRNLLLLSFAISLAATSEAQQRRLVGKVTDTQGAPIAGVKIAATSPDTAAFKTSAQTNAKGEFAMMVLAESVSAVKVHLEKEGFVPAEDEFELTGSKSVRDFRMESLEAAKARSAAEAAKAGPDPAEIHNAGAEAAKAGDWATAVAKFEEALGLKEDIWQTQQMLAIAAFNSGDTVKAEKAARRSLELNPTQPELMSLHADALEKLGNKTEATAIRAKLAEGDPKLKAVLAFNRGAELANQKKDPEAIAAFEEAIASDPALAEAHYNLGITAFRAGDMVKARAHLDKYLELDPQGRSAKTAQDIIKAIPAPKKK